MAVATAPLTSIPDAAPSVAVTRVPGQAATDALAQALLAVGDRWSLAVVAQLARGPHRFSDLATAVAPIARTVLSERLRRLEELGVVAKRQYSEAPTRYSYRLTLAGAELARVCAVLADWSARHLGDGTGALVHEQCGEPVQPAYACLQCGPVPAREVS